MKAKIVNFRHETRPTTKTRPAEYAPERWIFQDGDDTLIVWLDEDGLHSQRQSPKSDGSKAIICHGVQSITWTELVAKSEKQLTLDV